MTFIRIHVYYISISLSLYLYLVIFLYFQYGPLYTYTRTFTRHVGDRPRHHVPHEACLNPPQASLRWPQTSPWSNSWACERWGEKGNWKWVGHWSSIFTSKRLAEHPDSWTNRNWSFMGFEERTRALDQLGHAWRALGSAVQPMVASLILVSTSHHSHAFNASLLILDYCCLLLLGVSNLFFPALESLCFVDRVRVVLEPQCIPLLGFI